MSSNASTLIIGTPEGNDEQLAIDNNSSIQYWRIESNKSNGNAAEVLLLVDDSPTYQRVATLEAGQSITSLELPGIYKEIFIQLLGTVSGDNEFDIFELPTI